MKTCSKCQQEKSKLEFYESSKQSGTKDGLQAWCKPCVLEYSKKRYRSTTERRVQLYRQRVYGMSPEDYEIRMTLQGGRCAACLDPLEPGNKTHIDHCHETGRVRGLLCRGCNVALGQLRDDPVRIRALAEYAEEVLSLCG